MELRQQEDKAENSQRTDEETASILDRKWIPGDRRRLPETSGGEKGGLRSRCPQEKELIIPGRFCARAEGGEPLRERRRLDCPGRAISKVFHRSSLSEKKKKGGGGVRGGKG